MATARARKPKRPTARDLVEAAKTGTLNLYPDVTVEQLIHTKDEYGIAALNWAAERRHLDQIQGVTIDALRKAKSPFNDDGLWAAALGGALDQIPGGVTAEQLGERLEGAVRKKHLDQVKGGVTLGQLAEHDLIEDVIRTDQLHLVANPQAGDFNALPELQKLSPEMKVRATQWLTKAFTQSQQKNQSQQKS